MVVLRFLLIACFFAGLVWGLNYFYNSDFFKIDEVEIGNNIHYSDKEVMDTIPGMIGSNIFELDMKDIEERLTDSFSWLKSVEIEREFPRKVKIEFTERQAYVISYNRGQYFLIDEEGVVIEVLKQDGLADYDDTLVVKNALDYSPALGEKIAKKNILSCAEIYKFMDPPIKDIILEARIKKEGFDKISFFTEDYNTIVFGDSDNITEKNAVLKQILNNLSKEDKNYSIIDISDYQSPVIR